MADIKESENPAFWLPTHFLTEEKPSNDPKMNQIHYDLFDSGFGSDPFDSPDNDDVLLLSHLTRHFSHISLHNNKSTTLEKPRLYSTSPQSTLSGFGSSNNRSGYSSPPLTPELKNDAAWDLLYEAAGQIARLKINAMVAEMNNNRGLVGAPRHTSRCPPNHHLHCHCGYHQPRRSSGVAWTPLTSQSHHYHHHHRNRMVGPTMEGVKRRSTGTGVFLPRRISTSPPPPPRSYQQRPQPLQTKPTEIMWARRNVMLEEQRKTENKNAEMVGQGHELSLPNDWIY